MEAYGSVSCENYYCTGKLFVDIFLFLKNIIKLDQDFVWIDVYLMYIYVEISTEMRHTSNKCCNTILLRITDKF